MPILRDKNQIRRFLKKAADPQKISIWDTETSGLEWWNDHRICGIVVKAHDGEKHYIPTAHALGKNVEWDFLRPLVRETLENPNKKFTGHGFAFDAHMFRQEGVILKAKCLDSMLGCHLANENEKFTSQGKKPYKLETLAAKYGNPNAEDAENALLAKIGTKDKIWTLAPEEVYEYAIGDVDNTELVFKSALSRLQADGLVGMWQEIADYLLVTIEMEKNGIPIDIASTAAAIPEVSSIQTDILNKIRGWKGQRGITVEEYESEKWKKTGFNPNSFVQVCEHYGIPSSAREILEDFDDDFAKWIIAFRQGTKVIGSFFEPFINKSDANGYLHANINLHGTVSGRPSCSNPNLQALKKPSDEEEDFFGVRNKVVAPEGWELWSFDWSQIELRLLTHYTQSPMFVKAYEEDRDIHQLFADELGMARDNAKRLNLGVVYTLGAEGLSRKAKIPLAKARQLHQAYHQRAPEIRRLQRACEQRARENGYIKMWTGRRKRYIHEWEHRKAMSGLIQGGVAEIMRYANTRLYPWVSPLEDLKMLLQVHDEILFMARKGLREKYIPRIMDDMERFDFKCPIKVECKIGDSWGKMEKWAPKTI